MFEFTCRIFFIKTDSDFRMSQNGIAALVAVLEYLHDPPRFPSQMSRYPVPARHRFPVVCPSSRRFQSEFRLIFLYPYFVLSVLVL
jgi:hypothetical protein